MHLWLYCHRDHVLSSEDGAGSKTGFIISLNFLDSSLELEKVLVLSHGLRFLLILEGDDLQ